MQNKIEKVAIITVKSLLSAFSIFFFFKIGQELYANYSMPDFDLLMPVTLSLRIFLLVAALLLVFLLVILWFPKMLSRFTNLRTRLYRVRWLLGMIITIVFSWVMLFSYYSLAFNGWWYRLLVVIFCITLIAWLFSHPSGKIFSIKGLISAVVISSTVFIVLNELLNAASFTISPEWGVDDRRSLFILLAFLVFLLLAYFLWESNFLKRFASKQTRLHKVRWLLAIILSTVFSWMVLNSFLYLAFNGWWYRALVILFCIAIISWLFSDPNTTSFTFNGLLSAILIFSAICVLINDLQTVSSYPFSLSWSEGNRLWDYSIPYGSNRYIFPLGQRIPSYTSAGFASLWGLPFLFPNASITLVRLWNVILNNIPYFIFGLVLFFKKQHSTDTWLLLALWTYLFLKGGPIFAPLVLTAILVALSRKSPLWLAIILVAVAGYYASESRFTWVFAAGMWAALVAFLDLSPEKPLSNPKRWWRAIILGATGIITGYLMPKSIDDAIVAFFTRNSGSVTEVGKVVGSIANSVSLSGLGDIIGRQPLLWNRLLPNTTYPPGILLGLIIAVAPLILFLFLLAKKIPKKLNVWQKLLLFGELAAFLIVGLVISLKIGGGADLHNLDMFLIALVFVAALLFHAGGFLPLANINSQGRFFKFALLLVVLFASVPRILDIKAIQIPPSIQSSTYLQNIQDAVDQHSESEILFIDQRQLLTFGFINNVPLVPDYEKKLLMDMALADDADYFAKYISDLQDHRFSLILTEPAYVRFFNDDLAGRFRSEDDLWVKWVIVPLVCNYEPVEVEMIKGISMLIPRSNPLPADLVIWCQN